MNATRRALVFGAVSTLAAISGVVAAHAMRSRPDAAEPLLAALCRPLAAGTSPAERRRAQHRRWAAQRAAQAQAE